MTEFAMFRPDAGPGVGLGHLRRCLSLAAALRQSGRESVFLTDTNKAVRKFIETLGFGTELSPTTGKVSDVQQTLESAIRHKCGIIIVDSYRIGHDYLNRLRQAGLYVVAVDDLARIPFPCQMVINNGLHAKSLPYLSTWRDTCFLLGPEYTLLSQEFWTAKPRITRETVRSILITLGGADSRNLMPELLAGLDTIPGDYVVTATVGPFFTNKTHVKKAASSSHHPVNLIPSPESVFRLMADADLAISAGGHTLYELAATGTPTLAIQVADNQKEHLNALAEKGIVRTVGTAGKPSLLKNVWKELSALMHSADARRKMSAAGQGTVDGKGALRAANEILKSFEDSTSLHIN
jgi:UDP-2,4-diacetamido-2,4,6-trideoxy-beta-L-altropyranose hydrolase